ncbi:MAG: hypothetical protein NTX56_15430 [Proteobacteria bacterium]|nr:hypothetical protein [Pseudomonadota bacterium]
MNPAGALHIQIIRDGSKVLAVDITSSRPRAAQWLSNQPVDASLARLPLLYSVCRRAQESVGHAAVAATRGQFVKLAAETAFVILCETTQEHLWRLLLDWPRQLGLEPLEREFSHWYRRLAASAKLSAVADMQTQLAGFGDFVASVVLGMPCPSWLDLGRPDAIDHGAALASRLWHTLGEDLAADTEGVPWLPVTQASELAGTLESCWSEEFERHPRWRGEPAETGSLARWRTQPLVAAFLLGHGRGVRARLLARLMDLAECAGFIAGPEAWIASSLLDSCSPLPGVGIARIETARGTLLHRVGVESASGREFIKEYSVVAPTEWNFHPRGAFVAALPTGVKLDTAAFTEAAHRLVLSLDPCVPYQLEVRHA